MKHGTKEVVCVFVITGYSDGSIDFSQDAPRKNFGQVMNCMRSARLFFTRSLRNGIERCPFSPKNKGKDG